MCWTQWSAVLETKHISLGEVSLPTRPVSRGHTAYGQTLAPKPVLGGRTKTKHGQALTAPSANGRQTAEGFALPSWLMCRPPCQTEPSGLTGQPLADGSEQETPHSPWSPSSLSE